MVRKQRKNPMKIENRIALAVLVFILIGAGVPQPAHGQTEAFPRSLTLTDGQPTAAIAPERKSLPDLPAIPRPVKRSLWVTVTAYSSTVDQTDSDPFTTASGEKVRDGIIAWNSVPFGTEVRIPDVFGDKVFVVQDRLNERASPYHLDIWMPTRADAVQWGARIRKIEVL